MKKDMSHIKNADSESSNHVTVVEGRVHLAQPYALTASARHGRGGWEVQHRLPRQIPLKG